MNKYLLLIEGTVCDQPQSKEVDGICYTTFMIRDSRDNALRIATWARTAENCRDYLQPGRRVRVKGRIDQARSVETCGVEAKITDVVSQSVEFLPSI